MRRALTGPCLLFEDFGDAAVAALMAEADRGAEWAQVAGTVCVTRYVVGSEGRAAREAFVASAAWRTIAVRLPAQPAVHWLAEREMSWPRPAAPSVALVYTVDVERLLDPGDRARGVPARQALPEGLCWPVIGHPGRILALCDDDGIPALIGRFERTWGPAAEPPARHVLGPTRAR